MSIFDGDLSVALTRITKSFGSGEFDIAYSTRNSTPFSDHKYPFLVSSVEKHITSKECVRSSKHLVQTLKEIINDCLVEYLQHCWRMQSVKSRLDCLMKLTIPFVVTPHLSSLVGGEIGRSSETDISFLRKIQKIIIQVFTFFIDSELLVYETGSDSRLDPDRARLLISLLIFKKDTFSILTVLVNEYSPEGLIYLSQHLLGVSALCEDITEAIQSLTFRLGTVVGEEILLKREKENGNGTGRGRGNENEKEKEKARANQHETEAGIQSDSESLQPLHRLHHFILDYFQWLRNHKGPLIKLCRVVEVIHCVHPSLRFSLQNETYQSSQDIILKYKEKYSEHLTLIPLPLHTFRRDDVRQATKDALREEILINGREVKGEDFIGQLLTVISETFFVHDEDQITNTKISASGHDAENSPTILSEGEGSGPFFQELHQRIQTKPDQEDATLELSFPNEQHRQSSNVDFVELLLRFILIAVSRTYASGDAFFVLEDLFGGEGLCLCGGTGITKKEKMKTAKKTRVNVRSDHVLVELFQNYDLYLSNTIGSDESLIAPLVSFETKVVTLITLKPPDGENKKANHLSDLFLLLSASPEKICHRLLTVIPFLPDI